MASKLIHASLEKDGVPHLFGSDMMDPSSFVKGDSFSVVLDCSSENEINDAYEKLSAGGKITMEFADAFWGAKFASFTDRFGVDWQLNWWKPKKDSKE
jgi:PhnB protein